MGSRGLVQNCRSPQSIEKFWGCWPRSNSAVTFNCRNAKAQDPCRKFGGITYRCSRQPYTPNSVKFIAVGCNPAPSMKAACVLISSRSPPQFLLLAQSPGSPHSSCARCNSSGSSVDTLLIRHEDLSNMDSILYACESTDQTAESLLVERSTGYAEFLDDLVPARMGRCLADTYRRIERLIKVLHGWLVGLKHLSRSLCPSSLLILLGPTQNGRNPAPPGCQKLCK